MIRTYKDVDYIVHFHQVEIMSFYTAYIRLPENHPWITPLKKKRWFTFGGPRIYGYDYDAVPLEVHGGLTSGEYISKKNERPYKALQGFSCGYWVGWDYGHAGDAIYPEKEEVVSPALEKLRKENPGLFSNYPGDKRGWAKDRRWKESAVEKEVIEAIEQVLKAGKQ